MIKISDIHPLFIEINGPKGKKQRGPIDLNAQLVMLEAKNYGIEPTILPGTDIVQLKRGQTIEFFKGHTCPKNTVLANKSCIDKVMTRSLLENAGVKVMPGFFISETDSEDARLDVFHALHTPLVVKPTDGTHSNGVVVGISQEEEFLREVEKAFHFCQAAHAGVLVEEQFMGQEYRILATRDKVIGVINRIPAHIIGNGKNTIQELIDEANAHPLRNILEGEPCGKIVIDEQILSVLKEKNLNLSNVLPNEEYLQLRKVSNISAGGESVDITDEVHESVKQIALSAIQAIPGLHFAGIDFMTKDIRTQQSEGDYTIIEINSSPEFDVNQFPMTGTPRPASYEFLKLIFPDLPAYA